MFRVHPEEKIVPRKLAGEGIWGDIQARREARSEHLASNVSRDLAD